MDLNSPMTLEEWQKIPPLPGLENVATMFKKKWLEAERVYAMLYTLETLRKSFDAVSQL